MIGATRRWFQRNRKGLAIGAGVIGAGYLAGQYVLSKISEARERMSSDRIAREKSVPPDFDRIWVFRSQAREPKPSGTRQLDSIFLESEPLTRIAVYADDSSKIRPIAHTPS